MTTPEKDSLALRMAIFAFGIDQTTAEVTTALADAYIPCILLKGPAIANWLYSSDDPRLYSDTDLLVRKEDWSATMGLLEKLGFEDDLGPLEHPRMESGSGYAWFRPSDNSSVDLHYTLFGVGAKPETVWTAFSEGMVTERVGSVEVAMPSHAARLMHISLHAVQHGGAALDKPMEDLERAISRAPESTWVEARRLAERLDASGNFSLGLQITAAGRELAASIGAEHAPTVNATLRLDSVPMSEGIQELHEAQGTRAKLFLIARELFPNRAFMEWWSPMARRGKLGLIAAYFWRPIWLAIRAIPAYRAWNKARRQSTKST